MLRLRSARVTEEAEKAEKAEGAEGAEKEVLFRGFRGRGLPLAEQKRRIIGHFSKAHTGQRIVCGHSPG